MSFVPSWFFLTRGRNHKDTKDTKEERREDSKFYNKYNIKIMTYQITERLYKLIPAIYQTYDRLQGESLRALLALLEQELQTLETDIEGLYENWFIETCDDWVVPYIGDLLDVQRLSATSARTFGQERRAYVANTLAYRRRKGTVTVLEQLAQDVSGWRGKTVEFIDWLATTQALNTGIPTFTNTVD